MKKFASHKKAFTLAEVLIVLMILGVIASLTIPSLRQNTEGKENATALKKAHATLANVSDLVLHDGVPLKKWKDHLTDDELIKLYTDKLNVVRNCEKGSGCFVSKKIRKLSGSESSDNFDTNGSYYKFVTADGMTLAIQPFRSGTTQSTYGLPSETDLDNDNTVFMEFVIDTNNDRGPNMWGKDIFRLLLTPNGILPAGADSSSDCVPTGEGKNCAAVALRQMNTNY